MARPTLYDEELRSRLLIAAAEQTALHGAESLSLRQVASRAGTSTTAIYTLFGGKNQMLTAVIEEGFISFTRAQEAVQDNGLLALGRAYRQWALENPVLYSLMFAGPRMVGVDCAPSSLAAKASLAPLIAEVTAAFRAISHTEEASILAVAGAIWGQVHGLVSLELSGTPALSGSWQESYEAAVSAVETAYLVS